MKHQIYHKLEPQLQNKIVDGFHVLQPFILILVWVSKCPINHLNTTTVPTAKTA